MSRTFPTERVRRADVGPASEVVVIRCAGTVVAPDINREVDCGKRLEIASKSKEPLPLDFVIRQATIKGWHVGKLRASEDRCPDCLHRRKIAMRPTVAAQQEPEPMTIKPSFPTATAIGAATPTREMQKLDRRIIFSKIESVYLHDHYSAGWTDKRIAEDLNVPRAWVTTVREENFGEAGDNEEVRQFMSDLDAVKGGLEAFATERQSMLKRMDDLAVKVSKLLKIGEEIRKSTTP